MSSQSRLGEWGFSTAGGGDPTDSLERLAAEIEASKQPREVTTNRVVDARDPCAEEGCSNEATIAGLCPSCHRDVHDGVVS